MTILSLELLQQRVAESDLGREWINDSDMIQDRWSIMALGYSETICQINSNRNIYFNNFSLSWLKLLAKLTAKAMARQQLSIRTIMSRIHKLNKLNDFLSSNGYTQPEELTEKILYQFIDNDDNNSRSTLVYALNLWAEEGWLKVSWVPPKYKLAAPKIEIIPEEVLDQIYEKFDLLPPPLERLFRLQLVLGSRIGEMLTMPYQCLKQEGNQWFLLRWLEKRQHWQFSQIHPLVVELVQEQQRFLDAQFGQDNNFDKLFCKVCVQTGGVARQRFVATTIYKPEILPQGSIRNWLQAFSEEANLKDKHGNKFYLTSHMFRRTKASIMAHCEAEDEYIAAMLGHSSLDMLPHYRKRCLARLEKETTAKGYVNMYGQATTFKPRKQRYDKLADLLKVSTPLGECHRPTMLGDCQYRYACLSCTHHRVTLEDKPKLEADLKLLQQDLEQAQSVGQERRVTEIYRLLNLLSNRLQGLNQLPDKKFVI